MISLLIHTVDVLSLYLEEYSGDGSEFVIADIFNNFGDIADNQDETAEPGMFI